MYDSQANSPVFHTAMERGIIRALQGFCHDINSYHAYSPMQHPLGQDPAEGES